MLTSNRKSQTHATAAVAVRMWRGTSSASQHALSRQKCTIVWTFRPAANLYVDLIDGAKLLHQQKVELCPSQDNELFELQLVVSQVSMLLCGPPQVAMVLIRAGADPTKQDRKGVSPLHYASCSGTVQVLLHDAFCRSNASYIRQKNPSKKVAAFITCVPNEVVVPPCLLMDCFVPALSRLMETLHGCCARRCSHHSTQSPRFILPVHLMNRPKYRVLDPKWCLKLFCIDLW